jgi:hypothetical protein
MTDHPDEKVLRREKELIRQVEDEKERADLLSIAMPLAFHYFKKADWVWEYFTVKIQFERLTLLKKADFPSSGVAKFKSWP